MSYNVTYQFSGNTPTTERLGIVIPFRNREEHLSVFIPHFEKFVLEHKNKIADYVSILVVEQEAGKEFNRGKLLNIGYSILKNEVDYVCFHDVDCCPVRADYRNPREGWAHLISKGPETIRDPRGFFIRHNMAELVGGVTVFSKKSFDQINGYSNSYWGWGFEDLDLNMRCVLSNVPFNRRSGKYLMLPHQNEGFDLEAEKMVPTTAHKKNSERFNARFERDAKKSSSLSHEEKIKKSMMLEDGLTALDFSVREKTKVQKGDCLSVERVLVSI